VTEHFHHLQFEDQSWLKNLIKESRNVRVKLRRDAVPLAAIENNQISMDNDLGIHSPFLTFKVIIITLSDNFYNISSDNFYNIYQQYIYQLVLYFAFFYILNIFSKADVAQLVAHCSFNPSTDCVELCIELCDLNCTEYCSDS